MKTINRLKTILGSKWILVSIAIFMLIVQVIMLSATSWLGRNAEKIFFITNWSEDMEFLEPITAAEVAELYSREHVVSYTIFRIQNPASSKEHWAAEPIRFYEEKTGNKIINPDKTATIEQVLVLASNLSDYSDPLRRQSVQTAMKTNRLIALLKAAGIMLLILCILPGRLSVLASLVCLHIMAIISPDIMIKIILIILSILIVYWCIKGKSQEYSSNKPWAILFHIFGFLFIATWNAALNPALILLWNWNFKTFPDLLNALVILAFPIGFGFFVFLNWKMISKNLTETNGTLKEIIRK